MARSNFRIEQGLEILEANGTGGVWVLRGTGAPVGTTGPTDDAPVGSVWAQEDSTGALYQKKTDTSSATDWKRFVNESIYTAIGISFDDEDMGAYTGNILTDDQSTKTNIQELSDAIEAISGGTGTDDDIPAATPTTVSTCLVDTCNDIEWEVQVWEQGDKTKREAFKFSVLHDGTPTTDATTADETTYAKRKTASIAGLTYTAKLTGTGAGQTIGIEVSATGAITVLTRRTNQAAD